MMNKLISILMVGGALCANAGEVLKITPQGTKYKHVKIAHYGEVYYHWVLNDEVCLIREIGKQEKLCGNVVSYDKVETVLRFEKNKVIFGEGEKIKIMFTKRTLAAAPDKRAEEIKVVIKDERRGPQMNASVGFGTGFTYLYFAANFRYLVSPKISLGMMPVYINDSGVAISVRAFGGFLTGEYYFKENFSGFNLASGLGLYAISATAGALNESTVPFAFFTTAGWRGKVNQSGVTVGGGLGVQIVSDSQRTVIVDFKGVLPLLQLEVGYSF